MVRKFATLCAVLTMASILAVGSAWMMVLHGPNANAVAVGPWRMSTVAGSVDADIYTRARVAITGLFALNPSETLYFEASTDDAGQRLRADCTYRVEGAALPARWWSVTAYGDDFFLIANPINRFSFNMGNLGVVDGRFSLVAAATEQRGNWLPTGSGGFRLIVRLYNPHPSLAEDPRRIGLPSIRMAGNCK